MYIEIGRKYLGQFGRGIIRFSCEELRLTLLKLWKSNKKASTRVCCLTEFCKKAARSKAPSWEDKCSIHLKSIISNLRGGFHWNSIVNPTFNGALELFKLVQIRIIWWFCTFLEPVFQWNKVLNCWQPFHLYEVKLNVHRAQNEYQVVQNLCELTRKSHPCFF